MKRAINITRPIDKVLLRPISTQNEKNQAQRDASMAARRAVNSVRTEKKNGRVR